MTRRKNNVMGVMASRTTEDNDEEEEEEEEAETEDWICGSYWIWVHK
jgi:hypothetical protein